MLNVNVVQALTSWAREASSSSSVTPLTPRIVISAGSSTSASPHADVSAGGLGVGSATMATPSSSAAGAASSGIFSGVGVYAPHASSGGGYGGSAAQKADSDARQAVRGTLSVETAGEVSLAPSEESVSTPIELPFSPYNDMPHTPDVRSVRALRQHDDDETSTYSFVRKKSSYRYAGLINYVFSKIIIGLIKHFPANWRSVLPVH